MSLLRFFRKEKKATAQLEPATVLCMILSQRDVAPDDANVRAAVQTAFGSGSEVGEGEGGVWMLRAGPLQNAFASFMPAPIPTGEAEAAAESFLWQDGSRFAGHRSHVVLGSTVDHGDRVRSSLALTELAAALLDPFNGTAVYWGPGSITVPREQFVELANGASSDNLPLFLWCRFQLIRPHADHIGLYTVGLQQFGLMEIEVDRSSWESQELLEFVYNLAHYLIQAGPVIKHGDTVGGSAEQRIVVEHGRSMHEPQRNAYKIIGM